VLDGLENLDLADMMASLRIDEKACLDVVHSRMTPAGIRAADILGVEEYIRLRAKQWVESGGTWQPMPCVTSSIKLTPALGRSWGSHVRQALVSGGNYRGLWIDGMKAVFMEDMWLAARDSPDALEFLIEKRVPMCPTFFAHAMTTSKYRRHIDRMASLVKDINAVEDDFTYLMRAVAAGNEYNIEVCVKHGANVNLEVDGCNALAYAFGPDFRPHIFDLLLELGAELTDGTINQLRFRLDQLKQYGSPCSDLESRVAKCLTHTAWDAVSDFAFYPSSPIYNNDEF
jgi:hypothetical protein